MIVYVFVWVYSTSPSFMSVSVGFILLVDEFTFTLITTPSYNGPALWCENVLRSHRSKQLRYLVYLL